MPRNMILLIGLCIVVAACQPPPTPTSTPLPTSSPAPTATLGPTPTQPKLTSEQQQVDPNTLGTARFVMAVPDLSVDIYLESNLLFGGFTYSRITNPVRLAPDSYLLRVMPVGKPPSSKDALLEQSLIVNTGESTINILTGSATKLISIPLLEDLTPLSGSQTRLSINYASLDNVPTNVLIDNQPVGKFQSNIQTIPVQLLNPGPHSLKFAQGDKTLLEQSILLLERQSYTFMLLGASSKNPQLVSVFSPPRREAQLRVLHVSPKVGPIDVYLGKTKLANNLAYRQHGDWQKIAPFENATIRVLKAGAKPDDAPLFSVPLTLKADQMADLAIFDKTSMSKDTDGRQVQSIIQQADLFTETLSPTTATQARLSILNLAFGSGQIQALIDNQNVDTLPPLNYATISASISIAKATQFQLAFDALDSQQKSLKRIEFSGPLNLTAGSSYLYVVVGNRNSNVPALLLSTAVGVGPAATPTPIPLNQLVAMRVIDTLPDVDALDVTIDDKPIFTGLKFGQITTAQQVYYSAREIKVIRSISNQTLVTSQLPDKLAGPVTIVATGTAQNPQVIISFDKFEVSSLSAVLRVIAAAPKAASVSLEVVPFVPAGQATSVKPTQSVPLVKLLVYPSASQPARVSAGKYTINLHNTADSTQLSTLPDIMLEAGAKYDLLILPDGASGIKMMLTRYDVP